MAGAAGRRPDFLGRVARTAMNGPPIVSTGRRLHAGPWLPAATLLALAVACFARLAAEPSGLMVDGSRPSVDYANRGDPRPVGNDLVFLFLPHHEAIARRIAQFPHWPTWDARGFGGRPMAGNPPAGWAFAPVWVAWWLRAPAALGWLTVAHLLWGGLGTYVLVRSMGPGRWAATVAAGIYQASPYLLAHTFEGHYPHVWAACWYPWAFWAYREHRAGRTLGLLVAPVLALSYLTGHPQEWLLLVTALTAWAVADGLRARRSDGPPRSAARVVAWLGLLGVSIGMAGVDVMPQCLVRPWLRRNHDPGLDVGVPRRYHLGGLNAFQLLDPMALGGPADYIGDDNYWETVCSIGLVPLVLAVIGAARYPDRRLARGWIALAAVAVAFACGRALGVYPLCYAAIPGFGLMRVPARALFLANLAGAVLAGLGVQVLQTRMADLVAWRRLARRLGVVGVIAIGLLLSAPPVSGGRASVRAGSDGWLGQSPALPGTGSGPPGEAAPLRPPPAGRAGRAAARVLGDPRFWTAIGGTSVLLALGCRPVGVRRRRVIAGLIGLVGLGELGWYGYALIRVAPAERFVGPDPVGAALARLGAADDTKRPPARIKARDAFYGDLPASLHGIEKTNVEDAFQLDRPAALYETLYPVASRVRPMAERRMSREARDAWRRIRQAVFDRMSVGFLVSDRVESDPAWSVAADGPWHGRRFVIQRNPTAMPRAYIVPRATVLPDHPDVVLSAFAGLDPRESVVMSVDPLAGRDPNARQPFTVAEWTSADRDRPALLVTTRASGLLVVADTWMPGWTATVDGRPAPVLRGNHAQRVIALPGPGRHEIVMSYHPPGLVLGCVMSIVSTLAWGLMLILTSGIRRLRHSIHSGASLTGGPGIIDAPSRPAIIVPARPPVVGPGATAITVSEGPVADPASGRAGR
jgi:hypothetical protein